MSEKQETFAVDGGEVNSLSPTSNATGKMDIARSNRADVRNPMLKDPRIVARWERLQADHPEAAVALEDFLKFISEVGSAEGEKLWRKAKYTVGAYWKAKGVDARHLRLASNVARRKPC